MLNTDTYINTNHKLYTYIHHLYIMHKHVYTATVLVTAIITFIIPANHMRVSECVEGSMEGSGQPSITAC